MTDTGIVRLDRYNVAVNGHTVRATEDQERRLREMTPEQLARFLTAAKGIAG